MKKLLLITSLLTLAPVVYGQTTNRDAAQEQECKLTLATAPAICGLRLGMTEQQVIELFLGDSRDEELRDQLRPTRSKFGLANLTVAPSVYPSKAKFAGVYQVGFT